MAHSLIFNGFHDFILSEDEIEDIVEMFYRWDDATFVFERDEQEKKFRGQHQSGFAGRHFITLSKKNIIRDFTAGKPIGSNYIAPTLKIAAAMVIAHELQHANQDKFHKGEKGFYGHKNGTTPTGRERKQQYWNRACEREARSFVEEHMTEICAYFAVPYQNGRIVGGVVAKADANREALAVAELLREGSTITMDDIKEELRISKILTPTNVKIVIDELKKDGFTLEGF